MIARLRAAPRSIDVASRQPHENGRESAAASDTCIRNPNDLAAGRRATRPASISPPEYQIDYSIHQAESIHD
ncbi:hypothetical protein [Burkholderia thailandensis]|uniref:hypothetical protein n=1 Tax=Burkholderia thailandensis TaxID=57975 RepID=UPI000A53EF4B|nr:hypothetical protein [Burkholderia thailandensis]